MDKEKLGLFFHKQLQKNEKLEIMYIYNFKEAFSKATDTQFTHLERLLEAEKKCRKLQKKKR